MKEQDCETVSLVAMLRKVLKGTAVCILVVSMMFGDVALGTSLIKTLSLQKREKRNSGGGQTTQCNDQLTNIIHEYNSSVDSALLRFAPATPSPEDVNCYVEVPVTRRVGGRCVLLGSRTWGCQAGIFLAFSSECQNEVTSQAGVQAQAGAGNATRVGAQGVNRARNPFRRRRRPN